MQKITCRNELAGGIRCGEPATLLSTQFVYRQEFTQGQFEQVLSEIHYNVDCPNCGQYTVVKTGSDVDDDPDVARAPGDSPSPGRKRQLNGENAGRG